MPLGQLPTDIVAMTVFVAPLMTDTSAGVSIDYVDVTLSRVVTYA